MDLQRTYQNKPELKDQRRFLRQNNTGAESILWQHIRNRQLGCKFRRQFGVLNFIVDFYCHELRLIVELDGWTHDSEKTKQHDVVRQRLLESDGYKIIRFTNEQVFGDIEKLLEDITGKCKKRERELERNARE